ncbi:multidrug ABC transporter permease [filamentous cyanobacterium CCP1]|nr:multidrug ABC transporter permease [filamentous cyanobacterium CCP2]PSB64506.1 multidrug ABC transporter permease [filamentous cyanobacterium CCP1]
MFIIIELEVRKLRHDPSQLITRAAQPTLWLVVFGQVFTRIRAIPTGDISYLDFMTPGILAQSVLFMAIFNGLSIIWEKDLGILHKLMVSPTPRVAMVLGKAIASGIRSLSQAVLVYVIAYLLGVQIDWNPLALIGVLSAVILGASLFSTLSLIVACTVKTHERFMGVGQLLTMPLFFASNAIYPIAIMPQWLQMISFVNPLTYLVDALRGLMLLGESTTYPVELDFSILFIITAILATICGRLYPRLVT